jgi:hypothetical protein
MQTNQKFRGLFFLCLFSLYLVGCLSPDTTNSGTTGKESETIEDNDLLAGSSSRTTWPPDIVGDTVISILLQPGKSLTYHFRILDSLNNPVNFKISGKLTLFRNGGIPAIDSVPSFEFAFVDQDSVTLSADQLLPFAKKGQDSIVFNIRMESPHWGNSFLMGFKFHLARAVFSNPELSFISINSVFLIRGEKYFHGPCDLNTISSNLIGKGKSVLSFYIPGTPYFWKITPDSINLGPVPEGLYPLRLLRITDMGDGLLGSEVEVFEMLQLGTKHTASFQVGNRILEMRTEKTISLRVQTVP